MTTKTASAFSINVAAFLRWLDRESCRLVLTAVAAQAFAKVERERVNAYVLPFFATWGFRADKVGGERLTNPRDLYLSDDDDRASAYYAAVDALHREHGFTGPEGHCPALTAEYTQIVAENALIASMSAFLGVEPPAMPEHRAQMLDIATKAAVKRMAERAAA